MEENTTRIEGGRELNAAAANDLAQELNERGMGSANLGSSNVASTDDMDHDDAGAKPVVKASSDTVQPSGDEALEAEEEEKQSGLFPPDVVGSVEIGGSPEDARALEDEYRRG